MTAGAFQQIHLDSARASNSRVPAVLVCYDRMEYDAAWVLQRRLVQERMAEQRFDTLLLLEHEPVFTIGRTGQASHWGGDERLLQEAGYRVYHVERGGSVTYHGPGQLVGYPILRLGRFCPGPKTYMRLLEEVLIRTLAEWGIEGRRIAGRTGVWVGNRPAKIAAMGVRIVQDITMHGFALNVAGDFSPFERIMACGIPDCSITSMAELLGRAVEVSTIRQRVADIFAEVFDLTWMEQGL